MEGKAQSQIKTAVIPHLYSSSRQRAVYMFLGKSYLHHLKQLFHCSFYTNKLASYVPKNRSQELPSLPTRKNVYGFPSESDGKEYACNAGVMGSIPRLERSSGEGNGYPPQYSCLENSRGRGAWRARVH